MFPQRQLVLTADDQFLRRHGQIQVVPEGHQVLAHGNLVQVLAQVFPDLAGEAVRVGHDVIQRAMLGQPLHRGLGPYLGNPRHVVRGVADQGQVIDDALRRHAVFFNNTGAIKASIVHGVDQVDIIVDDLRQVLIAG